MPSIKNVHNTNPIYNSLEAPVSPVEERSSEYRHSIIKSKETPLSSVLEHIEGSNWYVDYGAQIKARDEEPNHYDINASVTDQQYHLIRNFNMKLQSQDTSTEDRTNSIGVSGTAIIYAGVIPNVGDVLISDIGNGIAGRHTVERVTKKTYFKTTVYEIEYRLVDYLDAQVKEDHFMRYVVKQSVFNTDLLKYGNDPVVSDSDYSDILASQDARSELIDDFIKEFGSLELGTICVPNDKGEATYDPFLTEAFRSVVNVEEHYRSDAVRLLNVNELKGAYDLSIWPVLIDPSVNKLRNNWFRAGLIPQTYFAINPLYNSFRFSGFKNCVSPTEDLNNIDYYNGWAKQSKVGNMVSAAGSEIGYLGANFGKALGDQLSGYLSEQNKVCCHHLVHYHEMNRHAAGVNSRYFLDTVHRWIRATGHWDACSICGGCTTCCPTQGECGTGTGEDGCEAEDKNSYVFPYSFWKGKTLDDPYLNMVRRHIKGDIIPLGEVLGFINNRLILKPKERFYRSMVLLIILTISMRRI